MLCFAVVEFFEMPIQTTHPTKACKIFAGLKVAAVGTGVLIIMSPLILVSKFQSRNRKEYEPPIALPGEDAVFRSCVAFGIFTHEPPILILF
jgi:hypothetical protein